MYNQDISRKLNKNITYLKFVAHFVRFLCFNDYKSQIITYALGKRAEMSLNKYLYYIDLMS